MPEPVKLSRERWEMLAAKPPAAEGWCYPHAVTVTAPREIDGITFLPTTYVPAPDPRDDRPNPLLRLNA